MKRDEPSNSDISLHKLREDFLNRGTNLLNKKISPKNQNEILKNQQKIEAPKHNKGSELNILIQSKDKQTPRYNQTEKKDSGKEINKKSLKIFAFMSIELLLLYIFIALHKDVALALFIGFLITAIYAKAF
jgi:hypothetical protein